MFTKDSCPNEPSELYVIGMERINNGANRGSKSPKKALI